MSNTNNAKTVQKKAQPKLTLKQRIFIEEYFKTGNGVKSAMKAYDTTDYSTAGAIASENLKKLKITNDMLMEARGLSTGDLIDTVQEARAASKWNDFTGEREADHNTRLHAVKVASRWMGLDHQKDNKVNVNIQQNFMKNVQSKEYDLDGDTNN